MKKNVTIAGKEIEISKPTKVKNKNGFFLVKKVSCKVNGLYEEVDKFESSNEVNLAFDTTFFNDYMSLVERANNYWDGLKKGDKE